MTSRPKIRKAVFPVAGLGGAFLPATKVVPKEMLPLLDRPLIQYAVEEAVEAGCETFIFVVRPDQDLLARHFTADPQLDAKLRAQGGAPRISVPEIALREGAVVSVIQDQPRGLGHAVLCAREAVGDEPFAVILPDDVIDAESSVLKQMMGKYSTVGGALIAGIEVRRTEVASYGVMSIEDTGGDVVVVKSLEEKPDEDFTSSNFAITGRYLLPPEIFEALEQTSPDANGAIQLTDALNRLIDHAPVHGQRYQGERFDCGGLGGYVRATLSLASRRSELREEVLAYMRRIVDQADRGDLR